MEVKLYQINLDRDEEGLAFMGQDYLSKKKDDPTRIDIEACQMYEFAPLCFLCLFCILLVLIKHQKAGSLVRYKRRACIF